MTITNSTSPLWEDLQATERFPFATAARRYTDAHARKQFAERVRNNNHSGHEALRGFH